MKPPKCVICSRTLRDNVKFARVSFLLTKEETDYNQEMRNKEPKIIGWSVRGEAWFCEFHLEAARNNQHLHIKEAIKTIKNGTANIGSTE